MIDKTSKTNRKPRGRNSKINCFSRIEICGSKRNVKEEKKATEGEPTNEIQVDTNFDKVLIEEEVFNDLNTHMTGKEGFAKKYFTYEPSQSNEEGLQVEQKALVKRNSYFFKMTRFLIRFFSKDKWIKFIHSPKTHEYVIISLNLATIIIAFLTFYFSPKSRKGFAIDNASEFDSYNNTGVYIPESSRKIEFVYMYNPSGNVFLASPDIKQPSTPHVVEKVESFDETIDETEIIIEDKQSFMNHQTQANDAENIKPDNKCENKTAANVTKPTIYPPANVTKPTINQAENVTKPTINPPAKVTKPIINPPATVIGPTIDTPATVIEPTIDTPAKVIRPTIDTPATVIEPTIDTPATVIEPTIDPHHIDRITQIFQNTNNLISPLKFIEEFDTTIKITLLKYILLFNSNMYHQGKKEVVNKVFGETINYLEPELDLQDSQFFSALKSRFIENEDNKNEFICLVADVLNDKRLYKIESDTSEELTEFHKRLKESIFNSINLEADNLRQSNSEEEIESYQRGCLRYMRNHLSIYANENYQYNHLTFLVYEKIHKAFFQEFSLIDYEQFENIEMDDFLCIVCEDFPKPVMSELVVKIKKKMKDRLNLIQGNILTETFFTDSLEDIIIEMMEDDNVWNNFAEPLFEYEIQKCDYEMNPWMHVFYNLTLSLESPKENHGKTPLNIIEFIFKIMEKVYKTHANEFTKEVFLQNQNEKIYNPDSDN